MTSLQRIARPCAPAPSSPDTAFALYQALSHTPDPATREAARQFLQQQLETASSLSSNLPADPAELGQWVTDNCRAVTEQYRQYLEHRRAGGQRKFFANKAHALYFLQQVAPSKLVDGAWLYGAVRHADDWRYHGLVRTYLEELGDGEPALNHVVLYRNLLAEHDCAPLQALDDMLYVQGAIQLALGHLSDEFLPEVLGYNLGYEQLPLHLLISAFELNELGIDPYYFTLHVTIDNASSGHAHKAVAAVLDLLPDDHSQAEFLRRLRAGYLLNDLGKNSTAVIASFDLEQEVVAMLEAKSTFGQHMHSDYCRLEGRTINEWLGAAGQSRQLLGALEKRGWIKRNQDPRDSRFWQLIDGPGAVMFGVFSGFEMQLLRDWIAGDWQPDEANRRGNPFRPNVRRHAAHVAPTEQSAPEVSLTREELIAMIAPHSHSTPQGLAATRAYAQQLSRGCLTR